MLREAGGGGEVIDERISLKLGIAGVVLVGVVAVLVTVAPGLTILGGVALAVAALCLVPIVFAGVVRGLPRVYEGVRSGALFIAVSELRATSTRSIALAGIAALAVYGSIAIGGARDDLLRGIDGAIVHYFATADIWVVNGDDVFNTNGFPADGTAAAITRIPGVASVRTYQGGLLDIGARRLWVRARPPQDGAVLEAGQVVSGVSALATRRIRQGGWVAISSGFADERHLRVGRPSRCPRRLARRRFEGRGDHDQLRMAAWRDHDQRRRLPSLLADQRRVGAGGDVAPGVDVATVRRAIRAALATRPGLRVRTSGERAAESEASARQGLRTLSEISTLLLIAAALSVASALSATVWQRRARLASLKIQGFDHRQLWRALLLESLILLGIGCWRRDPAGHLRPRACQSLAGDLDGLSGAVLVRRVAGAALLRACQRNRDRRRGTARLQRGPGAGADELPGVTAPAGPAGCIRRPVVYLSTCQNSRPPRWAPR